MESTLGVSVALSPAAALATLSAAVLVALAAASAAALSRESCVPGGAAAFRGNGVLAGGLPVAIVEIPAPIERGTGMPFTASPVDGAPPLDTPILDASLPAVLLAGARMVGAVTTGAPFAAAARAAASMISGWPPVAVSAAAAVAGGADRRPFAGIAPASAQAADSIAARAVEFVLVTSVADVAVAAPFVLMADAAACAAAAAKLAAPAKVCFRDNIAALAEFTTVAAAAGSRPATADPADKGSARSAAADVAAALSAGGGAACVAAAPIAKTDAIANTGAFAASGGGLPVGGELAPAELPSAGSFALWSAAFAATSAAAKSRGFAPVEPALGEANGTAWVGSAGELGGAMTDGMGCVAFIPKQPCKRCAIPAQSPALLSAAHYRLE